MIVFSGEKLKKYLQQTDHFPQARECKAQIDTFFHTELKSPRVLCLYGLRRTGKTVLMQQEMRSLQDTGHTLLVTCQNGDSMYQLGQMLDQYPDCRYIFLDEVTRLTNFINTASVLSDYYAAAGIHICMAGTDSLGFALARQDELFDRVDMIHTTFIPFREYHRLLGKDIMSYIQYGGTLTDGQQLYNDDRKTGEYTNSAIADNIVHSLRKWGTGTEYDILRSMVENGDLSSAIRKVLEAHTGQFMASVINEDFKSHDKGSLYDLLTRARTVSPEILKQIDDEAVRPFLYIKHSLHDTVSDKACEAIERYLQELDIVYYDRYSDRDIFIQPGMRYAQALELADAFMNNDLFLQYTEMEREQILNKMESDICGQILEDIVFYQLTQVFSERSCKVCRYRNPVGQEIDVLVEDLAFGTSAAIEVKLSDRQVPAQWKHLEDGGLIREIEEKTGTRVSGRAVVYTGKTEKVSDTSQYLNAEDLLMNPKEIVGEMLAKSLPKDS